jgi:hypothetical protein
MIDRIKELKLRAGIQDNPDQEGLDLFAELIIEACAELADCPNSFKHRSGTKILRYFGLEKQLA